MIVNGHNMHNIKDLETEGFVVIKNFLSSSDVIKYNNLFNDITDRRGKKIISGNFEHDLNDKIQSVLKQVHEHTDIKVDIVIKKPAFFDNTVFEIDWHQDHEPYWLSQDSYNSLNFWIPIVKENPNTSGLVLVPHSKLPDDVKEIVIGTGAKTFIRDGHKTIITDNSSGEVYQTDFDLDYNSVIPEVSIGDLILMRVDVIHKSQKPTEPRTAMSVRCYYSQSKIHRDKFFTTCEVKTSRIAKDQLRYKPIADSFKQTTDDFILVGNNLQ